MKTRPAKKPTRVRRKRRRGAALLPKDLNDINVVPNAKRDWWQKVKKKEVRISFAPKFGKKWSDAEVERVITADPDSDTYADIAQELKRSPGSIRRKRHIMIDILRDQYGAIERAKSGFHKHADYRQVYEVLQRLGKLDLGLAVRFRISQPLLQPRKGWRGDGSLEVATAQRQQRAMVKTVLQQRRNGQQASGV
jgi:hypothetical protein